MFSNSTFGARYSYPTWRPRDNMFNFMSYIASIAILDKIVRIKFLDQQFSVTSHNNKSTN